MSEEYGKSGYSGSGGICVVKAVYSQIEVDELTMFGWKVIETELMDDGRTRYKLKRVGVQQVFNSYSYYQKKQPMPSPVANEDDLDWLT
jgi:hypothetical protein